MKRNSNKESSWHTQGSMENSDEIASLAEAEKNNYLSLEVFKKIVRPWYNSLSSPDKLDYAHFQELFSLLKDQIDLQESQLEYLLENIASTFENIADKQLDYDEEKAMEEAFMEAFEI